MTDAVDPVIVVPHAPDVAPQCIATLRARNAASDRAAAHETPESPTGQDREDCADRLDAVGPPPRLAELHSQELSHVPSTSSSSSNCSGAPLAPVLPEAMASSSACLDG